MTLRDLLNALRETYCGTIGAEYMYLTDQTQSAGGSNGWRVRSKPNFDAEKKKHILDRLTAAEGLERFLHTKYVGQKRFSLEGGESFIAAMDEPDPAGRCPWRARNRHRHGPPGPSERVGEHLGQDAWRSVCRV